MKADSNGFIVVKKYSSSFFIKLLCICFVVIDSCLPVLVHVLTGLLSMSFWKQVQCVTIYFVRFLLSIHEQLGTVLCLELKVRFIDLNQKILSWSPESNLRHKKGDKLFPFAGILSAISQFSNLSLAFKEVNRHFGLFWLLIITTNSVVLVILMAGLSSNDMGQSTVLSYAAFCTFTALRLLVICFVGGDTSFQVKKIMRIFNRLTRSFLLRQGE